MDNVYEKEKGREMVSQKAKMRFRRNYLDKWLKEQWKNTHNT